MGRERKTPYWTITRFPPDWHRTVLYLAREQSPVRVELARAEQKSQINSLHGKARELKASVRAFPRAWGTEIVELVNAELLRFSIEERGGEWILYAERLPARHSIKEILARAGFRIGSNKL